jgi:integrase
MGQLRACETVRAMTRNLAPAPIPTRENGTVPPRPVPHAERRPREYLTPTEVERLISAARQNRYGHRDATMILIAYRHGLRVAELCALRWDQVDFWVGRSTTRPGCQPMVLGLTSTD